MTSPDYYAVLNVKPSASQKEIRESHRVIVRTLYPAAVANIDLEARTRLAKIQEAYRVLGNPGRKTAYDAQRAKEAKSYDNSDAATSDFVREFLRGIFDFR